MFGKVVLNKLAQKGKSLPFFAVLDVVRRLSENDKEKGASISLASQDSW
jgi:hypothetical protein